MRCSNDGCYTIFYVDKRNRTENCQAENRKIAYNKYNVKRRGEEVYLENFMAPKTCRCGQCQMQRDKIKKSERNKRYYEAHKN